MSGVTLPTDLASQARAVLEANWRDPGFCVPHATIYPRQWLWDSCFHAVCWAHLGDGDRGLTEVRNALAHQEPDGFVPHMTYWQDDDAHAAFWGRPHTSTITQPPMYGHALAELHRLGVAVPDVLIEQARLGLRHLLTVRMRDGIGPVIVHPWESGCDDSARWDAWCPPPWSRDRWKVIKGELVDALADGANLRFEVASAGFGALVAFNARELAGVADDADLQAAANALADQAFGGRFGSAATHRDEPTFDPDTGEDLGAVPQSWTALAAVVASRPSQTQHRWRSRPARPEAYQSFFSRGFTP